MTQTVIKVENLYKEYKLGVISHGTLIHDFQSWWAKIRGLEDPNSLLSEFQGEGAKKDSFLALNDVSFEVKEGDRVGIMGRNGAGKSTLLKIFSRITSPTKGTVKIRGKIGSLLEVGTGFHQELTGRENIFLSGSILGMTKPEISRKLDEIIDFAEIDKYIDTPVKRYSSGMKVRLGFAVAANLDPEILIVDEVLAVGDMRFREKAVTKMQDVSRGEGRTVLFVSHSPAYIKRLCNWGILLGNGCIEEVGDINTITDLYLDENTEDLSRRIVQFEENKSKPISITEIFIEAVDKGTDELFLVTDTIKVNIKYTVHQDISGTNVSCTLKRDGVVIFNSWDIDIDKDLYDLRKAGKYEAEVILPDIINIGKYSISVTCGMREIDSFWGKEDVLFFDIENTITDGSKKNHFRGGLLKTEILWRTVRL
jgi:lipopolysaccharide transport system ATP-binding protein